MARNPDGPATIRRSVKLDDIASQLSKESDASAAYEHRNLQPSQFDKHTARAAMARTDLSTQYDDEDMSHEDFNYLQDLRDMARDV